MVRQSLPVVSSSRSGSSTRSRTPRVALVSMPWGPVTEPSLGLSILKAELVRVGIECRIFHFDIECLKHIRFETYLELAQPFAANDFAFSGVLEDTVSEPQFSLLLQMCSESTSDADSALLRAEKVLRFRKQVAPKLVAHCADTLMSYDPSLVGMTCSFDQTFASIALARALRERGSGACIALGGYAVSGETGQEILRVFRDIDLIAYGDGEGQIIDLAETSVSPSRDYSTVPNVFHRTADGVVVHSSVQRAPIAMNASPAPDFSDFLQTVARIREEEGIIINHRFLPAEFSRGCWWGQKCHCAFCGIDDETMKYRQRQPDNALDMLGTLRRTCNNTSFRLTDYILPHDFFHNLLPALARAGAPYQLYCEVKANLTHENVGSLVAAGFKEIQPGVESFSTPLLKLMRKGVSAHQNISLLLSAAEHGLTVRYNVLYGVPGERSEDYAEMAKLLPYLFHLEPPASHSMLQFTRNAPMQTGRMSPELPAATESHRYYQMIMSPAALESTGFDLSKYCYYFEPTYQPQSELIFWHHVIDTQCSHWASLHDQDEPPYLYYEIELSGDIIFRDWRAPRAPVVTRLSAAHARLYYSIAYGSPRRFVRRTESFSGEELDLLADLLNARVVVKVDEVVIALAARSPADAHTDTGRETPRQPGDQMLTLP